GRSGGRLIDARDFFYDVGAGRVGSMTEELNLGRGDLGAEALLAFTVGVLLQPQTAFNVNLTPPGQILVAHLPLPPPRRNAEPGRVLFRFAGDALALLGRGDGHLAKGRALRRVSQFGVAAQITDDCDLVERHTLASLPLLMPFSMRY